MNRLGVAGIIVSFLLGCIVMYFLKPNRALEPPKTTNDSSASSSSHHSMEKMSIDLSNLSEDSFDKAFLEGMIEHHKGALEMATQAKSNAKHGELKKMADEIISSQQAEIRKMEQWQKDWNY